MHSNPSEDVILSILIVNYNGKEFLDECFESVNRHVSVPFEIIVVDNASTDGSAEFIRTHFPDVALIESGSNLGFAAGNNLGGVQAKGHYILLLNNDTVLCSDLWPAIAYMEEQPEVGVLGAHMMGRNREYRYSAGHFPTPLRLMKISSLFVTSGHFRYGNFPEENPEPISVDWVEGSFMLTRKMLWDELGGLDEGYFMYVEDIDFCKRIRQRELKVTYFPAVCYIHYGGYGKGRLGLLIKGFRRFHRKFSGFGEWLAVQLVLSLGLMVRLCIYLLMFVATGNRERKDKLLSCWAALKVSPW